MKATFIVQRFFLLLITTTLLFSCKKEKPSCSELQNIAINPLAPVTVGDTIEITLNSYPYGAYYQWYGPGDYTHDYPGIRIYNAGFEDEGWYYLNVDMDGCESKRDSVYVDMKFTQVTAPCTLTNNKITFVDYLPDVDFYWVSYSKADRKMDCSGSYGDLNITFSSALGGNEPEDGVYITESYADSYYMPINKVVMDGVFSGGWWTAGAGKKVYVSHVNGKLRVSFCDVELTGSINSRSYTTKCATQLTSR